MDVGGARGGGRPEAPDDPGGRVNLLRDLEVLMEVKPRAEQEGGAAGAGSTRRQRKKLVGHLVRGAAAAPGPRPTLKARLVWNIMKAGPSTMLFDQSLSCSPQDPDLYMALMRECSLEEATPPGEEYAAPPLVINYLVRNDVRPLKKRSVKFPKAQYYCRLCDYHCDTLTICISHIKVVMGFT